MSAFTQSGHSITQENDELTVRFRPQAAIGGDKCSALLGVILLVLVKFAAIDLFWFDIIEIYSLETTDIYCP